MPRLDRMSVSDGWSAESRPDPAARRRSAARCSAIVAASWALVAPLLAAIARGDDEPVVRRDAIDASAPVDGPSALPRATVAPERDEGPVVTLPSVGIPAAAPSGQVGGASAETVPKEQPPEIHYLPDDSGRLVPVPGFRYRDFLELLELKEGLPGLPRPPALVIERLTVEVGPVDTTDAGGGIGVAEVAVTADLRQSRDGWTSAVLGLEGLFLSAGPVHDGPGRFVLASARDGTDDRRGYRAWVEGSAGDRHTLTLSGSVRVDASDERDEILLDLPSAASSVVTLRSRRGDPLVAVHPPTLPPRVSPDSGGGSVITCAGLSGPARIRIGARAGTVTPLGAIPQASVESLVRIDGRVATFDAVVRMEGLPSDADTVRVSLPPRCSLVRVREPATLVRADPPPVAEGGAGTVVEVRIGRRGDGAAVVELECERPVDPSGRALFDPFGFAIDGVPEWRQRGRVALIVAGEWQLDWDDPATMRRVDPAASARQPGFVAAFAYDAQPATLPMRVRPRASRVVVEPEYRVTVGATRISLEAKFRVAVRGAPVGRLVVGLEGWTIDEVTPPTLVDAGSVTSSGAGTSIPFIVPLSGDAVVEVRAARAIERSADAFSFSLPQPRADLVGPAITTVTSAADIDVIPDGERMRGLVRQVLPAVRRGAGDRGQLVYRIDGTEGTFAATRRFLPRSVDAAIDARIAVGDAETTIEERIRLDVARVALESIDLVVPPGAVDPGEIAIVQGTQTLAPFDLPAADTATAEESGRAVRSLLGVPLLGTGEIVVRYAIPTPAPGPEGATLRVPLLVPRNARIAAQSLTLAPDEALAAEVRGDLWKRDAVRGDVPVGRAWVAARAAESVELALSPPRPAGAGETAVEAAWLETSLLPDRREDVCTYAVSTTARRLVLEVPEAWRAGTTFPAAVVDVRVGGVPIAGAVRDDGTVVIDVTRGSAGAPARSSFALSISASRPWSGVAGRDDAWSVSGLAGGVVGPVTLEAPRFPAGTLERRYYWEILAAQNEHVIGASSRLTPQQRWIWWTGGLRRESLVSRATLADWVTGALRAGPDAAPGGVLRERPVVPGRALFAGTGAPGRGRVWLVPTWLLVLAVSGPVLALGLAMVYRPGWRRLPAVLALLLPATLAAVTFPSIAPLVVQGAIPGVVLSLVAAALRRATVEGDAFVADVPPPVTASTRLASPPSLVVNVDDDSGGERLRNDGGAP